MIRVFIEYIHEGNAVLEEDVFATPREALIYLNELRIKHKDIIGTDAVVDFGSENMEAVA